MIDPVHIAQLFLTTAVAAPATGSLTAQLSASAMTFSVGAGQGAAFESDGYFPVIIDGETIRVTRSGDVFTVDPGGRGACGTAAAIHLISATVSQANFYLLAGNNVYSWEFAPGVANAAPAVSFEDDGSGEIDTQSEAVTTGLAFTIRGGSTNPLDCRMVARALIDRFRPEADGVRRCIRMERTAAGTIMLASPSGGLSQTFNLDGEWPEIETNIDLVCRGN